MKRLIVFVAGSLFFGVAAVGAGYVLDGPGALVQGCTAFALTFLPAAGTLGWILFSYRADPSMMLLASLGGSGLRMAIALGGGLFLTNAYREVFDTPFWYWLVVFYPVFLAFEITLLVRQGPKLNGSPKA